MIAEPGTIDATDPMSDWLAERRTMIGASESPAILGCGYANESAWTVYARKIGELDEQEECEAFEWGHAIQPIALKMFSKRTGIKVDDLGPFAIQRHPDMPWIGATLDGIATVDGRRAVVEAKNVGQYHARDWADEDEPPPLRVQVQIAHQMLAADADIGFAVACVGGNKLAWRRIDRNRRFEAVLIERLAAFWRCVDTRTPPKVDGSIATAKALAALWPGDDGEEVYLPAEAAEWDAALVKAKADKKEAEARETAAANQIKAAIGEAAFGILPSGERYSWKTQERAGYTVAPSSCRVLLRRKS